MWYVYKKYDDLGNNQMISTEPFEFCTPYWEADLVRFLHFNVAGKIQKPWYHPIVNQIIRFFSQHDYTAVLLKQIRSFCELNVN